MILLLLWGLLLLLFASGMPVAFSFITLNIVGIYFFMGGTMGYHLLVPSIFNTLTMFILVPIPLFILMGDVLCYSGVALIVVDALDNWIGRVPGRLSLSAVAAGAVFAAVSGVPMGTTAMLGSVFVPEMESRGYSKEMSIGPVLGGGGLALVIPPTAMGVILAVVAQISVARLLMAVIVPGLLLLALYIGYIILRATLQPHLAPSYSGKEIPFSEKILSLRHVLPMAIIIFLVTGVIFLGVASPTEASALGALGSVFLVVVYRKLSLVTMKQTLTGTVRITVMVLMIIAGSITFSQLLANTGSTKALVSVATTLSAPPILMVILMQLIILLLGCFMDLMSITMITMPIMIPIINKLGFDPVWFCSMTLINLGIGAITPPLGLLLFTIKGVVPGATMGDVIRSAVPFVFLGVVAIALVMAFPAIALWLPELMR